MLTTAVRIYGKNDLRLETFELPEIANDEIRAKIITDSVCMSTHKLAEMGQAHKRAPKDLAANPAITGHEFCGIIESIGDKWKDKYSVGQKFILQTALLIDGSMYAPGFSFPYIGGNATYINVPNIVMEKDFLIPYDSDTYYFGSLAEPMACIAASFHTSYHVNPQTFAHEMEIKKGGNFALLAGAGPMGLGAIDYALHCENAPALIVVTDIDDSRLDRASSVLTPAYAKKLGIELIYLNTGKIDDPVGHLKTLSHGGFDDVFVMAPVGSIVEQADKILRQDGCLNFFAGPTNPDLSAQINCFNVHYASTHMIGTTGSRVQDMKEVVRLMNQGTLNPTPMITHIGGIDSVADTVINLPKIPGGKKLIYNQIRMPLTAIEDFEKLRDKHPFYQQLYVICKRNNSLWSAEAEKYLLNYFADHQGPF